ncbi:hypothetical protein CYCME_2053 [Cycloclasticus zancles 78-ME]|uniref:Uncharacterized protein n=1 Tax=Cycloclasticus zancles 78-ME TaxID=1198232 RepID=S5THM1_9GAMM|nr:hypothetical protein CYCME_2053 [Cycloclasticus zancles 78-ME]
MQNRKTSLSLFAAVDSSTRYTSVLAHYKKIEFSQIIIISRYGPFKHIL